jgi:hypothetical protein
MSSPPPKSRIREAIPPLPQYVFMAWCLVKHRDNFTFTLRGQQQHKLNLKQLASTEIKEGSINISEMELNVQK